MQDKRNRRSTAIVLEALDARIAPSHVAFAAHHFGASHVAPVQSGVVSHNRYHGQASFQNLAAQQRFHAAPNAFAPTQGRTMPAVFGDSFGAAPVNAPQGSPYAPVYDGGTGSTQPNFPPFNHAPSSPYGPVYDSGVRPVAAGTTSTQPNFPPFNHAPSSPYAPVYD